MSKKIKKISLIVILFGFLSCDDIDKISITKVQGSPNYDNAQISSVEATKNENDYSFSFEIEITISEFKLIKSLIID